MTRHVPGLSSGRHRTIVRERCKNPHKQNDSQNPSHHLQKFLHPFLHDLFPSLTCTYLFFIFVSLLASKNNEDNITSASYHCLVAYRKQKLKKYKNDTVWMHSQRLSSAFCTICRCNACAGDSYLGFLHPAARHIRILSSFHYLQFSAFLPTKTAERMCFGRMHKTGRACLCVSDMFRLTGTKKERRFRGAPLWRYL